MTREMARSMDQSSLSTLGTAAVAAETVSTAHRFPGTRLGAVIHTLPRANLGNVGQEALRSAPVVISERRCIDDVSAGRRPACSVGWRRGHRPSRLNLNDRTGDVQRL